MTDGKKPDWDFRIQIMTDLADRIEAAEVGGQREMLLAAFDAINRGNHGEAHNERLFRFVAMLNAEAYESAAMTLVPEGGFGSLIAGLYPNGRVGFAAVVTKPGRGDTQAATPALALCAAALRAQQEQTP